MRLGPSMGCLAVLVLAALLAVPAHAQSATAGSSQVIEAAPGVVPITDIDPAGNCLNELKEACEGILPGDSRLANCISDLITHTEGDDTQPADGRNGVTAACREEVYQFKITRNTNINYNIALAKACKVDAEKCKNSWMFGYKAGQVIACLKEMKDDLAPLCEREINKLLADGAEDYRADAMLHEACKPDAERLCKDVPFGGGRVQGCLRDHRVELHWQCEEQLFRQEAENADDVRLSVRLYHTCLVDKRRFCADVAPGAAAVKDCLENNRNDPNFTPQCKHEIDSMLERRVINFRVDSRLRTACGPEINGLCQYSDEMDMEADEGSTMRCLQDFLTEIKDQKCQALVKKYQELAAEDIRFNSPLAEACSNDRNSFCANVPPGSARVIRCLMKQRDKLSVACRAQLFDEEVKFSENIDFQVPMKKACQSEIGLFCKDMPHGDARVIRCLQDHKYDTSFGKECKEEVRQYEMEAASDYRLNHRLYEACKADVGSLCSGLCNADQGQSCGGTVLRCLIEKREEITEEACKAEVFYFVKMEVTDYRNDLILAAACRTDVDKFCGSIAPGEGRVHDCLRKHRTELSDACRKEELLLEEVEAENVELKPGVMRACKDERTTFCKGVIPGGARMFRCLAEKMGDVDFGAACRAEITTKLQRRQANWKLDPALRKACKPAVRRLCDAQDKQHQEKAAVYKCLIASYDELDARCQKELGRAMHMAFFIWSPDALLTAPCDEDIQKLCLSRRPNMDKTPGAVGSCLVQILEEMERKSRNIPDPVASGSSSSSSSSSGAPTVETAPLRALSPECRVLADVAEPPDMKKAFEASLSVVLLQNQLQMVEGATGVQMLRRDRQGNARAITLTGWTAVAGMAATIGLMVWGAGYTWRRMRGIPDKDYTLVVKRGQGHL